MMRAVRGIPVAFVLAVLVTVIAGKVIESPASQNDTASTVEEKKPNSDVDQVKSDIVKEAETQNPGTKYQELDLPKTESEKRDEQAETTPEKLQDPVDANKSVNESQKEKESLKESNEKPEQVQDKEKDGQKEKEPEVKPNSATPDQAKPPAAEDAKEKVTSPDNSDTKFDNATSQQQKVTYQGVKLVRVRLQYKEHKKLIRQLEEKGDIDTWMGNGTSVDILIKNNNVFDLLKTRNLSYDIVLEDLQRAIDEENPPLDDDEWSELEGRKVETDIHWWTGDSFLSPFHFRILNHVPRIKDLVHFPDDHFNELRKKKIRRKKTKKKKKQPQKGHRMTWQMYHRMSDIHGYLDYLANTYPDVCTQQIIGRSIEGKPLKVLKISSGKPNSRAIWVDSGIHAREWVTPATSTYIINEMVENGDGTHGVDWYFLPLVNPDGYEHSHTVDRLWRKNRSNPQRGPCTGTDLNRNFGYRWGGMGSSQIPCRETYSGSRAFSEPETDAIREFVMSKSKDLKAYISLHSYGQYILYPWGYDRKVPPDYSDLHRVGRAMALAMKESGGQNYKVGSAAATLYPAAGGSDDWAKGTAKIKYAYTIELRDTGRHGFVLPAQYILPTARETYAALKVLANEVLQL